VIFKHEAFFCRERYGKWQVVFAAGISESGRDLGVAFEVIKK